MNSGILYENIEITEPKVICRLITVEKLKQLVAEGFDINEQNEEGNTYLHKFTDDNNFFPIKLLCEAGADLEVKNKDGLTPYQIADGRKGHTHPDMIRRLLISHGAKEF